MRQASTWDTYVAARGGYLINTDDVFVCFKDVGITNMATFFEEPCSCTLNLLLFVFFLFVFVCVIVVQDTAPGFRQIPLLHCIKT